MAIDKRKLAILNAIIQNYILKGEPIGSRTLSKSSDLGVSSATIRNEMSDLEELGFLEKTHTSSGRIPSDKAYRYYVDHLIRVNMTEFLEREKMKRELFAEMQQLDQVIKSGTKILSQFTKYTSIAMTPQLAMTKLKHIQLVPVDESKVLVVLVTDTGIVKNAFFRIDKEIPAEHLTIISNFLNDKFSGHYISDINQEFSEKVLRELLEVKDSFSQVAPLINESIDKLDQINIVSEGLTNLFNYPEYGSIERAREILEFIGDRDRVIELLNSHRDTEPGKIITGKGSNEASKVDIIIGSENAQNQLKDCSLITATYSLDGREVGKIGVIGPKRMRYANVIQVIQALVLDINDILDNFYKKNK
ncbi:MAG: heat-inducible transcriptional repressor HrcA [Tissierellales bacterium]|jgi:heat-inducible transcriptional repressor|nr:heat-inducible transcriptional repressor HrcA [Tissierellales bacterium]